MQFIAVFFESCNLHLFHSLRFEPLPLTTNITQRANTLRSDFVVNCIWSGAGVLAAILSRETIVTLATALSTQNCAFSMPGARELVLPYRASFVAAASSETLLALAVCFGTIWPNFTFAVA